MRREAATLVIVAALTSLLLAACAGPQRNEVEPAKEIDPAKTPQIGTLYLSESLRVESVVTSAIEGRLTWVMTTRNILGKKIKALLRPRYYGEDGRELVKGPTYQLKVELAPGEAVTLTDTSPVAGAVTFTCEFSRTR